MPVHKLGVAKRIDYYKQQHLDIYTFCAQTSTMWERALSFFISYLCVNVSVCPNEPIPLSGNGSLSSPNYPLDRYPPSSTCTWRITVSAGKRVKFAFIDFALGSCALGCSSKTCTYVEVYDGASASSPLLARYCHNSAEEEKISSGNQMFVKFSAGFSLDRGFGAQYSETMDPPSPTITSGSSLTTVQPTTSNYLTFLFNMFLPAVVSVYEQAK